MFLTLSTVSSNISLLALAMVIRTGPSIQAPNVALLNCKEQQKSVKLSTTKITVSVSYKSILNLQPNDKYIPQKRYDPNISLFICVSAHMSICDIIQHVFKTYYTFSVNQYMVTRSVVSRMWEALMYPFAGTGCLSYMPSAPLSWKTYDPLS